MAQLGCHVSGGGIKNIVTIDTTVTGSRPQTAGQSPIHPVGRNGAFDAKCQKRFYVTFEKSNKTPASPDTH